MENNLKYIEVDKIKENPLNTYDITEIDELQNSIDAVGLIEPLTVFGPDENGNYTLLSGARRLNALKRIGKDRFEVVPCKIDSKETPSEWEQKMKIEIANLESRTFDRSQHIFNVASLLLENDEIDNAAKKIKEILKCTDRYASMITRIQESGIDEVRAKAHAGTLDIQNAAVIAAMSEEEQLETLRRLDEALNKHNAEADEDHQIDKLSKRDTADIIKNKTKFSGKRTFTQDDLDSFDDDFDSFYDDVVTHVTTNPSANVNLGRDDYDAASAYSARLHNMIDWCIEIKERENLTEEEMDVVYACRDVVEKFL